MIALVFMIFAAHAQEQRVPCEPSEDPCESLFTCTAEVVRIPGVQTDGVHAPVGAPVLRWLSPDRALFHGRSADGWTKTFNDLRIIENRAQGIQAGAQVSQISTLPTGRFYTDINISSAQADQILIRSTELLRFGRTRDHVEIATRRQDHYEISNIRRLTPQVLSDFPLDWENPKEHFGENPILALVKPLIDRGFIPDPRMMSLLKDDNKFFPVKSADTSESQLRFYAREARGAHPVTEILIVDQHAEHFALFAIPGRYSLNFSPPTFAHGITFYALREIHGTPVYKYKKYEPGPAEDQRLGALDLVQIIIPYTLGAVSGTFVFD